MNDNRPLILISNDDGYHAKGINSLVGMLTDIADIIVCAPESARSGFSCAFTVNDPLRLKLRREGEGYVMWSCTGTPVDCVKLALDQLFSNGRKPDMIIGGINHGDNASVNTHYSGTMGITLEGCMKYIPSVAFSLCDCSADADFEPLRPYVRQIVRRVRMPQRQLPCGRAPEGGTCVPHGQGVVVQRVRETLTPTRLRILLDDGALPQR